MKTFIESLLLIVIIVIISLFLALPQANFGIKEKKILPVQIRTISNISPGLPALLTIPKINVYANIQQVGVTPKGEMDAPSNAINVGLFKFGPRPGEKGSAVIAGHFNGKNDEVGVFANLYQLKKDDRVYIENNKGITTTFIVRESRIYDSGYADEVFSKNDGTYLNLITCDGVWDGIKKTYSKRLVVFADLEI